MSVRCAAGAPTPNATFICSSSMKCYLYVATVTSWSTAISSCAARNMRLVTHQSLSQQQELDLGGMVPSGTSHWCARLPVLPALLAPAAVALALAAMCLLCLVHLHAASLSGWPCCWAGCAASQPAFLLRLSLLKSCLRAHSSLLPRPLCPAQSPRIGLSYNSSFWVWDGQTVLDSTIKPSQSNPYAHWAQVAATTFTSNSNNTCAVATSTGAYTTYTGDGSPAQQTAGFYVSDASAVRAWLPSMCSSTAATVCEGDAQVLYPCNVPPPAASPPPAEASCECIRAQGKLPTMYGCQVP
jgi:hypothetical protein